MAKPELLARVAEHKRIYFRAAWAKYTDAASGALRLVPTGLVETAMKRDYARMGEMLFGEAPGWDEIMAEIAQFEAEVNAATPQ